MNESEQTVKNKERIALDAFLSAGMESGLSGARMKQAMESVLAEAKSAADSRRDSDIAASFTHRTS
jgi:hypothetical protein